MEGIEVVFLDQTGAKRVRAKISPTVTSKQMLPSVITRMLLPTTAPDGTPMSYALDHKEGGKRLQEDQTLPDAGVKEGDHLIVYPEIVAGIDTLEYQRLIGALDQDIERARREHEKRERVEKIEQRRKLLLHWQQGLTVRRDALARFNGKSSVDIDGKLAEIAGELEALEREAGEEPKEAAQPVLSGELRRELARLIDEVNASIQAITERPYEERTLMLRCWSAEWRILTLKAGESVVGREAIFKAGFAAIANARDHGAPGERLPALGQHAPPSIQHWEEQRRVALDALKEYREARAKEDAAVARAEKSLDELRAFMDAAILSTGDEYSTLRHLVTQAASFKHLRTEVAELCAKHKDILLPDFKFLWPEDAQEEAVEPPATAKLTPLAIASRLCRRLKQKAMIGACHAPWDRVATGFGGHDYGRAEETLEVMAKVGMLRKRRTGIGFRVSIEPAFMPSVDLLIEGKPSGIPTLDAYLEVGAPVKAEAPL